MPRLIKNSLIWLNLYPKDNIQSKLAANILVLSDGNEESYTHNYGWMGFGQIKKV